MADDKKDRVIAKELGIEERTVRAHVAQILLKLNVRSRVGAAVALVEWLHRIQYSETHDEGTTRPG